MFLITKILESSRRLYWTGKLFSLIRGNAKKYFNHDSCEKELRELQEKYSGDVLFKNLTIESD